MSVSVESNEFLGSDTDTKRKKLGTAKANIKTNFIYFKSKLINHSMFGISGITNIVAFKTLFGDRSSMQFHATSPTATDSGRAF